MTDQARVTLDDLKRAIEHVEDIEAIDGPLNHDGLTAAMLDLLEAKMEAWQMGFEYLAQFHQPGSYALESPMDQAMRLIRERLK